TRRGRRWNSSSSRLARLCRHRGRSRKLGPSLGVARALQWSPGGGDWPCDELTQHVRSFPSPEAFAAISTGSWRPSFLVDRIRVWSKRWWAMRAAGCDRWSFKYRRGTIIGTAMIQRVRSSDCEREKRKKPACGVQRTPGPPWPRPVGPSRAERVSIDHGHGEQGAIRVPGDLRAELGPRSTEISMS